MRSRSELPPRGRRKVPSLSLNPRLIARLIISNRKGNQLWSIGVSRRGRAFCRALALSLTQMPPNSSLGRSQSNNSRTSKSTSAARANLVHWKVTNFYLKIIQWDLRKKLYFLGFQNQHVTKKSSQRVCTMSPVGLIGFWKTRPAPKK